MIKDRNDADGAAAFVENLEYTDKKLNFIFSWFWSGLETPVSKVLARKVAEDLQHPAVFARVEEELKNGKDGTIYYLVAYALPLAELETIEKLSTILGARIQKYAYFPIDLCCIRLLLRLNKDRTWLMEWINFKENHCRERMELINEMKGESHE